MTRLPRNKISISISIPLEILAEIDELSYKLSKSRSDFIVGSIKKEIAKVKTEKV